MYVRDRRRCLGEELRQAVRLVGVDHIEEVMRNGGALGKRRLGGAHVEAAIDLAAVGVDYLPTPAPSKRATRRRSCLRL